MTEGTDFLFVPKVDVNEGFTTGTVTKAAMVMTHAFVFIVPFSGVSMMGNKATTTTGTNVTQFLDEFMADAKKMTTSDAEKKLQSFLPENRVFEVAKLKQFSVQVGFWLFGGMRMAKEGGTFQVINVQPKEMRMKIKEFYGL